jgi:hypothetical protein
MSDSLITSSFDRALRQSPRARVDSALLRWSANLCIASFLVLATALGMAETEFVPEKNKRAWRAWGAPIGMVQYWGVFAPDLRTINWHSTAVIEFSDGSLKNYEFPRFEKMSLWEAFVRAPETELFYERMANLNYKKTLPTIARYLARANYDVANQPVSVTFVFHFAPIPVPGKGVWIYRDNLPPHIFSEIYFVYKVLPDDLAGFSKH